MAHALGITREELLLGHLDDPAPPAFTALLARRLTHEAVAYIPGTRAFWTIELALGPGALLPRPASETLSAAAVTPIAGTAAAHTLALRPYPGISLPMEHAHLKMHRAWGRDSMDVKLT